MKPLVRPRTVLIASPLRGGTLSEDLAYAKQCLADSLDRGEDPIASGMIRVHASVSRWYSLAEALVLYCDRGLDRGIEEAITAAEARGLRIVYRHLGDPK